MAIWRTLSARFTEEEVAVINEFKTKHNVTDNQMIRLGVQVVVGLTSMLDVIQSPNISLLKGFAEEVGKEVNSPHFQKAMKKASERWANRLKEDQIKQLEASLSEIQNKMTVFESKRTRGRPKELMDRGRPMDKGK